MARDNVDGCERAAPRSSRRHPRGVRACARAQVGARWLLAPGGCAKSSWPQSPRSTPAATLVGRHCRSAGTVQEKLHSSPAVSAPTLKPARSPEGCAGRGGHGKTPRATGRCIVGGAVVQPGCEFNGRRPYSKHKQGCPSPDPPQGASGAGHPPGQNSARASLARVLPPMQVCQRLQFSLVRRSRQHQPTPLCLERRQSRPSHRSWLRSCKSQIFSSFQAHVVA